MSKILSLSIALAAAVYFVVPTKASADYCPTYFGRPDGNCSHSPGRGTQGVNANRSYGGYGYDNYAYAYVDNNRVRVKTWRRGGKWYQDCGEEIGIVPVGIPCTTYRSPQVDMGSGRPYHIENGQIAYER